MLSFCLFVLFIHMSAYFLIYFLQEPKNGSLEEEI